MRVCPDQPLFIQAELPSAQVIEATRAAAAVLASGGWSAVEASLRGSRNTRACWIAAASFLGVAADVVCSAAQVSLNSLKLELDERKLCRHLRTLA